MITTAMCMHVCMMPCSYTLVDPLGEGLAGGGEEKGGDAPD